MKLNHKAADLSIYNRKSLFLSYELFDSKKIFISAKNHSQKQSKYRKQIHVS